MSLLEYGVHIHDAWAFFYNDCTCCFILGHYVRTPCIGSIQEMVINRHVVHLIGRCATDDVIQASLLSYPLIQRCICYYATLKQRLSIKYGEEMSYSVAVLCLYTAGYLYRVSFMSPPSVGEWVICQVNNLQSGCVARL